MVKIVSATLLLLLAVSCSSGGRSDRQDLRRLVLKGDWDAALEFIDKSDFYQKEESRLLMLMETGLIHHYKNDFHTSINILNQARDLSRELYTRSLSSQAKTLFANDNYDIYYGAPFERSLLHYYLALNHYQIYQDQAELSDQERRQHLFSARAEIMAWDSMLSVLSQEREGAVYKENLLGRYLGVMIHESMGTRDEKQIALQLAKDGLTILLRYYSAYQTFNENSQSFVKDFKKLPALPIEAVREKYIAPTTHFAILEYNLKAKVLSLTHELFPRDVPKVRREFQIDQELKPSPPSNVLVVIEEGLMPSLVGDKFYFGLDHAQYESEGAKILAAVGSAVISLFAVNTLGLRPAPAQWNPATAQLGLEAAHFMVRGVGIQFELPMVEPSGSLHSYDLVVVNLEGQQVYKAPLPLVHPLADVARQAVAEDSTFRYTKVGLRVALKHLAAIVASYGTYKMLSKEDDAGANFLARNAAVIQYVAASRAIAASERADTRHWSTLPQAFRLKDLSLPPGEYRLKLEGNNQLIQLPKLTVPAFQQGKIIHHHRIAS
jgi:hypothetical protein